MAVIKKLLGGGIDKARLTVHNSAAKSYVSMNRTTIVLPDDVKAEALKRARAKGVSFGALMREALDRLLKEPAEDAAQQSRRKAVEAMLRFGEDAPAGPPQLSDRLDDYLYGGPTARSES